MSRPLSAPPRCTRPCITETRLPVRSLRPALAQEIADQTEVVRQVLVGLQLRKVPAGSIGVDAVHERRVVAHLRRQRAEQMADPLLLLHVHVEVADHHDAAVARMFSLPRENSPDAM